MKYFNRLRNRSGEHSGTSHNDFAAFTMEVDCIVLNTEGTNTNFCLHWLG
jgi:hypothetical protein